MDTYEIGNFVRQWTTYQDQAGNTADPLVAICQVTDPAGYTGMYTSWGGSIIRHSMGLYSWDMIASRLGDWALRWLPSDGLCAQPDTGAFQIVETLPYPPIKPLPCLSDSSELTLIPLAQEHLEHVRRWRNRDDIRRWFFTSDVLSAYEQQRWFYMRYLPDPSDLMWVAHYCGQPVGTGALTHVDLDKREGEWSRLMIGEDCVRGKGLARRIAALVRDYGLDVLKLERIYGSLYTDNQITMHIDMAAGYMPVRVEGNITHVELRRKDRLS